MSQKPDGQPAKTTGAGPRKKPRPKYPKVSPARPGYATHAQYVQVDGGQILKPGLYWHGVRDATNTDTFICSPLEVIAMTSDDKGENYGRLLRFLTPKGEWREWAAPMEMLAGDGGELRGELLRMGVTIPQKQRQALTDYLMDSTPTRHALAATATGWHSRDLFVMPGGIIGAGDVVFQSTEAGSQEYTTAGTAAEMTSNAVIIDSARQVKEVIIDPNIIPDIAVDDASVMLDIPASVTAATGMDALTHAIEAYVSVGAHPLTDANALEAIRLINLWLPKAVDDGHNLEAREKMAFGQYLAGMAFNSAGLGLVHALAHQPGATHNLPHGVCNAILLPIIENFNRPNAVARFARVAQAMGVDTRGMSDEAASMSAIQAIRDLSARVGIPSGFSQLGVTKADIEGWLDKALADPCAPCNPRTASRDEVRELYLEAL